MKSVKYLEMAMSKFGYKFDKELAEKLNITKAAISQYKSGSRIMDEETCLALALALEIDPLPIIAAAGIDRAEKSGQHSLWEVFMTRMAATASALLLALSVNLFLTPTPAEAAPMLRSDSAGIYIMLNDF